MTELRGRSRRTAVKRRTGFAGVVGVAVGSRGVGFTGMAAGAVETGRPRGTTGDFTGGAPLAAATTADEALSAGATAAVVAASADDDAAGGAATDAAAIEPSFTTLVGRNTTTAPTAIATAGTAASAARNATRPRR